MVVSLAYNVEGVVGPAHVITPAVPRRHPMAPRLEEHRLVAGFVHLQKTGFVAHVGTDPARPVPAKFQVALRHRPACLDELVADTHIIVASAAHPYDPVACEPRYPSSRVTSARSVKALPRPLGSRLGGEGRPAGVV